MIKCLKCEYHHQRGNLHSCEKCPTKKTYGALQEQFLEYCPYYEKSELEQKKEEYFKKINTLPIDDFGRMGGKKKKKKKQ